MTTFFLLRIPLLHIAFGIVDLIAATACIALLGFYLSSVLHGVNRGVSFCIRLTAICSALYGWVAAEDNALLLGILLVFALIAAAMVLTRKVDWYGMGTNGPELAEKPSGVD